MINDNRFLAVSLQNEKYAIELLKVQEVIAPTTSTPLPFSPKHFIGLLNLRGQLIPVIDLRVKLNLQTKKESSEKAIVILNLLNSVVGIVVDSVDSVETFQESQLSETPETERTVSMDFVKNVATKQKELVLILDLEKLINTDEKLIRKAA